MDITVVIPTRNRLLVLRETLSRLERQAGDVQFEIVVVDDESSDGTSEMVGRAESGAAVPLTLIAGPGSGAAAARNLAIEAARAPVCLFINDDTRPRLDLLARHRDFHRRRPECEAALLGHIDLPPTPPPSPFMRWLATQLFDFAGITSPADVGGSRFFTSNVSAKTELLRAAGGFDEAFPGAAHEDIDLGLRLETMGMRLHYDEDAVVEHSHPLDLLGAIERCHMIGVTLVAFAERHPDHELPRRPAMRHRLKATALTALARAGVTTPRLQQETWRFLCHEAAREGYWDTVDHRAGEGLPPGPGLRMGATLARLASRDEDTRMPVSGRWEAPTLARPHQLA